MKVRQMHQMYPYKQPEDQGSVVAKLSVPSLDPPGCEEFDGLIFAVPAIPSAVAVEGPAGKLVVLWALLEAFHLPVQRISIGVVAFAAAAAVGLETVETV